MNTELGIVADLSLLEVSVPGGGSPDYHAPHAADGVEISPHFLVAEALVSSPPATLKCRLSALPAPPSPRSQHTWLPPVIERKE